MFNVASPKLAAAVTNGGGFGVIGGVAYTPELLREALKELKSHLVDKNAPFGVDLLIPKVGGNARKTKYVPQVQELGRPLTCPSAMITLTESSANSSRSSSKVVLNSSFAPSAFLQNGQSTVFTREASCI